MAKIPFSFTAIPNYFHENGWFDNPNTILFLIWSFSKCSSEARTIEHDHKIINLAPYEFITGRSKSAAECFLTEEAFRHQLNTMSNAGFLKKTPNSTPNRFTCYVWVTERFSKHNPQLNTSSTPNSTPALPPQSRYKTIRTKESHQSKIETSKVLPLRPDGLTDDLSSFDQIKNSKVSAGNPAQHNVYYQDTHKKLNEVFPGVFLSDDDLQTCISIKGSLEKVKEAIEYILRSPGRKRKIYNWPNTLATWDIKSDIKPRIQENEEMAKRASQLFDSYEKGNGWRCHYHHDRIKDQKVLSFEPNSAYMESISIPLVDPDFKAKVALFVRDKKMQRGRISKS
jgi:hypothetical protein